MRLPRDRAQRQDPSQRSSGVGPFSGGVRTVDDTGQWKPPHLPLAPGAVSQQPAWCMLDCAPSDTGNTKTAAPCGQDKSESEGPEPPAAPIGARELTFASLTVLILARMAHGSDNLSSARPPHPPFARAPRASAALLLPRRGLTANICSAQVHTVRTLSLIVLLVPPGLRKQSIPRGMALVFGFRGFQCALRDRSLLA